jgi:hypothetical protein
MITEPQVADADTLVSRGRHDQGRPKVGLGLALSHHPNDYGGSLSLYLSIYLSLSLSLSSLPGPVPSS